MFIAFNFGFLVEKVLGVCFPLGMEYLVGHINDFNCFLSGERLKRSKVFPIGRTSNFGL